MMLSMTTIYILPYLRYTYFTPLQEAMGLMDDATAYGNLTSVYGIMNLICYIPGGIIADKFDAKKLMVFSMVGTGVLGLWLSTWPGYTSLMIIHILFGITTVLTFWSSSVKVVNMLAASDEQGQMFGILEGGRTAINLVITWGCLALFAYLSTKINNAVGMTGVVVVTSVIMIAVGVVLAFLLPKTNSEKTTTSSMKESLAVIGKSFKLPITWCLAAVIFTCSVMMATASYYAPYLQGAFGMTAVAASTFATIRGLGALAASPIAGMISKKQGRSTGVIMMACIGLIILSVLLIIIPENPGFLPIILVIMMLVSFSYFCNRAVYWAMIDEAGTPKYMVGTVTGMASIVGFLPDTFLNTLYGSFMDKMEFAAAYRTIFIFGLVVSCLGLLGGYIGNRVIKKHQLAVKQENKTQAE